jgi:hypothetical protein
MYGDITAIPTLSGSLTIPTSSSAELIDKTITDNGVYNASDDSADGYRQVVVALPLGAKTITQNGTYNASSDNVKGFSSVTINVDTGITKVELTQSAYDSLSQAQKQDATKLYFIIADED